MDVMLDFVSQFLEMLLAAALPILAGYAVVWVKSQVETAKAKLIERQSTDLVWAIESAAQMAVKAAEQAKLAGFIEEKKEYALEVATLWLKARGMTINLQLLEAAIEAAVLEEFNRAKAMPYLEDNDLP